MYCAMRDSGGERASCFALSFSSYDALNKPDVCSAHRNPAHPNPAHPNPAHPHPPHTPASHTPTPHTPTPHTLPRTQVPCAPPAQGPLPKGKERASLPVAISLNTAVAVARDIRRPVPVRGDAAQGGKRPAAVLRSRGRGASEGERKKPKARPLTESSTRACAKGGRSGRLTGTARPMSHACMLHSHAHAHAHARMHATHSSPTAGCATGRRGIGWPTRRVLLYCSHPSVPAGRGKSAHAYGAAHVDRSAGKVWRGSEGRSRYR